MVKIDKCSKICNFYAYIQKKLNDHDSMWFSLVDDSSLDFIKKMGRCFGTMDSGKGCQRVRDLTSNTANALHQTLNGVVAVIKILLTKNFDYVLPGKLQLDRLEGEFGIYRLASGGNYFISFKQVVSSVSMQL